MADPIKTGTIAVRGLDVPVWYGVPETANSFNAVAEVAGKLWTGEMSPEEFATYVQDNLAAPAS